jgi:hypothetical protein
MANYETSGGLGDLISKQTKGKQEKIPTAPGSPIEDARTYTIRTSIQKLTSRLEKLGSGETTKSIEDWECVFDIRKSEGLFQELRLKGVDIKDNKNGTWTIKKE